MVRLFIFLAAVALVLLILALIGCLSAERVRALPRALWVLIVVFLPLAGPIAYYLWGRPVDGGARRPPARPSSPDDDPDFLRSMDSEQARRDRELLARWERELHEHDEPPAAPRSHPTDEPPPSPRVRPAEEPPAAPRLRAAEEPPAAPRVRAAEEPPAAPRVRAAEEPPAAPRVQATDEPPAAPRLRPADEPRPADDTPQARDDKPQARDEDRG